MRWRIPQACQTYKNANKEPDVQSYDVTQERHLLYSSGRANNLLQCGPLIGAKGEISPPGRGCLIPDPEGYPTHGDYEGRGQKYIEDVPQQATHECDCNSI
ncbi:hypothetical protein TNCT_231431 [Trichonephila clavata]|uniref:Uncharacterized protein n=1 Tax=Trichonephila clavata TaxID=2740835 RepID=A0A8X6LIN1_TRICU|nr:hypothetical protein TNCT_231431 [Trichonephila clavata]